VFTSGQHFGGTPLHQLYRCDRAARTSPQNSSEGSSGCTRVGMETCLVRLNNECTPTWGSRRVRANHTRHDPGRSVSHARDMLVCPATRGSDGCNRYRVSAFPEKTRANNNSRQQIIDFSRLHRPLRIEDTNDGLPQMRGTRVRCPLPSFLFQLHRE
jgi:hypothetical protein